eukprot:4254922-Pleurochrysis_carterae.AAC.1
MRHFVPADVSADDNILVGQVHLWLQMRGKRCNHLRKQGRTKQLRKTSTLNSLQEVREVTGVVGVVKECKSSVRRSLSWSIR